jgi:hypothetical protein
MPTFTYHRFVPREVCVISSNALEQLASKNNFGTITLLLSSFCEMALFPQAGTCI